jgi:hypothetical protein
MIKKYIRKLGRFVADIKKEGEKNTYKPLYKLIEIFEEDDQHMVIIKVINKNITFKAKPEEILANDHLVDQFSPRDIRTLTYLGYLGINGPKYKILAKKLSQNEKMTFVLKKKGDKNIIEKTADQIVHETEIILNLNSEDAKTVGYTIASESVQYEKKQKEALLKTIENQNIKDSTN